MRKCPFDGCGRPIPATMFACRPHWFCLSAKQRYAIHDAYNAYCNNRIGIVQMREIQAQVLVSCGQHPDTSGNF